MFTRVDASEQCLTSDVHLCVLNQNKGMIDKGMLPGDTSSSMGGSPQTILADAWYVLTVRVRQSVHGRRRYHDRHGDPVAQHGSTQVLLTHINQNTGLQAAREAGASTSVFCLRGQ
jgi:hypothetical protein